MKKIFLILLMASIGMNSSFGQNKPNIIVIYADDMGYADLSAQGSVKDIKTPNIDLLAKEGIRCTAGYVTAPQCSPSRAGLLTGRYQERYGFDEIPDGPLPLSEITIANRLDKAGYTTGQVGKWHLEPNAVTKNWIDKNIPDAVFVQGLYDKAMPSVLIDPYMPGGRGFNQYFTGYINDYTANFDLKGNLLKPEGQHLKLPGYRLDIQTDAALQFIKRNHQKPFFLYLAYFGPHVPLDATKKYLDRFPGAMAERRRYALAMISAIDDGVGQISEKLREYGIDENTMVVFASDNGAPLGLNKDDVPIADGTGNWDGSLNDPMLGEKGMLTEGGIRVPFIIKFPKVLPKNKVYNKPISTLDITATAVNLAGLPDDKMLDGVNLIPFLSRKVKNAPHDYLFWRFWTQTAVRNSKWKFINAGNKGSYLFDIEDDPSEQKNLISKYPVIAERLRIKLADWTKELAPPGIPFTPLRDQETNWYNFYLKK
jgi:arylsulfatase A-like enzyme